MYTLRLVRFKGFADYQIRFPAKGVVLLDGKSGAGKTTILDAISFVLYDNMGSGCYPRHEKRKSTSVELVFPSGQSIYRQHRPNLLRVQGEGVMLQDAAAQEYIDSKFGSFICWSVGGYMQQLRLSSFFTMSSDDKTALLQELADKDATAFTKQLDTTSAKIRETSGRSQELEAKVNAYTEMYSRTYNPQLAGVELWPDKVVKQHVQTKETSYRRMLADMLAAIRKKYDDKTQAIQDEISRLKATLARVIEQNAQVDSLQAQYDKLMREYKSLPAYESIDDLESAIAQVEEQIVQAKSLARRNQLMAAKAQLEQRLAQIPDERSVYTLAQLDLVEKTPTPDQIQQDIQDIKAYQVWQQVVSLEKQLEEYPTVSVAAQLEDIGKKIWLAGLQKLECPKCKTPLTYTQGRLQVLECCETWDVSALKAQKKQLELQEQRYRQRAPLEAKLQDLKKHPAPSPEAIAKYSKVRDLDAMLRKLYKAQADWEGLVPPESVSDERRKIANSQARDQLLGEIARLDRELSTLKQVDQIPHELKSLEERRAQLRRVREFQAKKKVLDDMSSKLKPKQDTSDLEQRIAQLQGDLAAAVREAREWEKKIKEQEDAYALAKIQLQRDKYAKDLAQVQTRLAAFQKIKAALITAEYAILDSVLEDINRTIAEILDALFEEDMCVTISSLKQLKTDERIKPQVCYQITYNGSECSKITDLSGGEGMRVSLAIAIAFSRVCGMPFLLLDESLSTLDVDTRESVMAILRRYLPDKLIITVNHDTTAGAYDRVYNVRDPRSGKILSE